MKSRQSHNTLLAVVLGLGAVHPTASAAQSVGADRERICRAEPEVANLLVAVLENADLVREPTSDAAHRSRLRGLLPTLRVGIRRGLALDSSLSAGTTDRSNLSRDEDLNFEGTLTFELGRLLFAREELSLFRERRSFELDRRALIEETVRLYFERRRLLLELDLGLGTAAERRRAALTILHHQALLDAWSNQRYRGCWKPPPENP